jgi:antitoxin (DNA-binding transcriptional repressor) of toxin-antitoxin stability system
MSRKIVNMHAARTCSSQLVARAERGERILIARAGTPVAELGPARHGRRSTLPPGDPLLDLDEFAVDGLGGKSTNAEIDCVLHLDSES